MKKTISFLLAAVMLLGLLLTGCGGETAQAGKKLEDKFLVQGGQSQYSIVIPAQPLGRESLAAEEFNYFLQLATGITLPVVADTAATGKYISLGRTAQFNEAFSKEDLSQLEGSYSSYFIASRDDNIYIASGTDYNGSGVLYAVYDLLADLIDYRYYHDNEIAYTASDTVNLWSYAPHTVVPSFDMRTHSTAYIYSKEMHCYRLKYTRFSPSEEWDQITIGHSQVTMFVSPLDDDPDTGTTYGQSHPEWFFDPLATTVTKNNNQLCWTAGGNEESRQKLIGLCADKMAEYVEMNETAVMFMFGQMDSEFVCQCDSCREATSQWAGSACGLQIAFVNELIAKTEEKLTQLGIDRELMYAIYAYKPTAAPPVKAAADGTWEPYSDRVIPRENMRIFYAPIRINYGFPIDAPVNAEAYQQLQGWDAVCDGDQLMAYMYDLNIRYYFANFFNLGTIGSMYNDLEEAGVSYLLSQGVSDTNICCFDELRAFCISQLAWDNSLNLQTLAQEFIGAYYKDAAQPMLELFQMICDQNATHLAVRDNAMGTPTGILYNAELYPRAFVTKMDEKIFAALEAITPLAESDPEQYELLKARICKEYLSNIYLKITLYKDYYSDSEIDQMQQYWDQYTAYWEITKGGEGNPLPDLFG